MALKPKMTEIISPLADIVEMMLSSLYFLFLLKKFKCRL
ncbi:MAG: hypothetical protein OJF59_000424 [Cytophagales bacterium]|nr:MAG: hypothetical protein OJF59_000424 [Cytophagales bacterium]